MAKANPLDEAIQRVNGRFTDVFGGRRLRGKHGAMAMSRKKLNGIMQEAKVKFAGSELEDGQTVVVERRGFFGNRQRYFVSIKDKNVGNETTPRIEKRIQIFKSGSEVLGSGGYGMVTTARKVHTGKGAVVKKMKTGMTEEQVNKLATMKSMVTSGCQNLGKKFGDLHLPFGNFPKNVLYETNDGNKAANRVFLARNERNLDRVSFYSYAEIGTVAKDCMKALQILKDEKIGHGDIKGANIMVNQGRAVLIDNDDAVLNKNALDQSNVQIVKVRTNAFCDPRYMKRAASQDEVHIRDQIAMGRTLYEMVTRNFIENVFVPSPNKYHTVDRTKAKAVLENALSNVDPYTRDQVTTTILDLIEGKVTNYVMANEAFNLLCAVPNKVNDQIYVDNTMNQLGF